MKQEVAIAPTPGDPELQTEGDRALEVTQQPPETFYKDQYGRKATFQVAVRRVKSCSRCSEQRLLAVRLLYESGKAVEKQGLLHVASGVCLDQENRSSLAVRIAEVSKNHLNQKFRLEIAVQSCPACCGVKNTVVTDPVLVMSKKKKRSAKQDKNSPPQSKLKRARAAQEAPAKDSGGSEGSSPSSSTVSEKVTAVIAEVGNSTPPSASLTMAPFTQDTPNLCLWANAAFDFLHKLQWRRPPPSASEQPSGNFGQILSQAFARGYRCPWCFQTYGDVPSHREDCDLKLLLEQGDQTTQTASSDHCQRPGNAAAQDPLRWSSDRQNFTWPGPPRAGAYSGGCVTPKIQGSPYNLSQELLQLSQSGNDNTQPQAQAAPPELRSTAADAAHNLNLRSWQGYATLSKLLHSSAELEDKTTGDATSSGAQWTGVLPPVGTLSSGAPTLPSALRTPTAQYNGALDNKRFSLLLSASKSMPHDTANLLREGEAALHADGNIANSLSNLSLSEFLRSNSVEAFGQQLSGSLSAVLGPESPRVDQSAEKAVQTIVASDFRDCGFPAFDASSKLLGFYSLLHATPDSPMELRFLPNLFALPDEMLQELESTVIEWKQTPSIIHTRQPTQTVSDDSLTRLKNAVLLQVGPHS